MQTGFGIRVVKYSAFATTAIFPAARGLSYQMSYAQ
jgi:hypothetical protein